MTIKRNIILILIFFCFLQVVEAKKKYPYQDPSLDVKTRVDDLLGRMTLEEKVAQLHQGSVSRKLKDEKVTEKVIKETFGDNSIGTLESPFIHTENIAVVYNKVQKYLIEKTRLGIPALLIAETLHGHLAIGATVFPQSIAVGATWNTELTRQMGQAIAKEASSVGVKQALAPVLDLSKDQRYGRVEECYGEDPYLVSRLGVAYITGMQGKSPESIGHDNVLCMAKHFAAYSVPNGGINLGPALIGERELRTYHLPAFEAAVKEAKVAAIMPSYNELDGIPAHTNPFLLHDILRKEWGFDGFVFSDYEGIDMLHYFQKVAKDRKDAALQSIKAGVDLEAPNDDCYSNLKALVKENKVDITLIDRSVRRVLEAKFKAGLFENPYVDEKLVKKVMKQKEHVALSQTIAEEAVVLLKNKDNILPLNPSNLKIALCGPNADKVQFGDYSYSKKKESGITLLEGLTDKLGGSKILYTEGCDLTNLNKGGFDQAITNAEKSDVVVVAVGGTSAILSGIGWGGGTSSINTCGEGFDRSSLGLPGIQLDLVKALKQTGKPVVVVMINGRGYSIPWLKDNVDGIVEAWYPGEKGGDAIANILLGKINPSGKLPISMPRSAGHSPSNYNHKPSGHGFYHKPGTPQKPGRDYVFSSPSPLYAFGFGLSYTKFNINNLNIDKEKYNQNDTIHVSVKVQNKGDRKGKEVIQLYVRDKFSSVTTPVQSLKAFKKVALEKGQTKTVEFSIPVSELHLINRQMEKEVEAGEFEIQIGNSSDNIFVRKNIEVL
ncbi:glycoside hydrolase family 3 N-terminal domain-containing protein [Prolixibacteraceae bacterium]|nr:glycoside hydrolase family 3 N-terminal domain-containing protein [Prolixibacteraceae bacterium]